MSIVSVSAPAIHPHFLAGAIARVFSCPAVSESGGKETPPRVFGASMRASSHIFNAVFKRAPAAVGPNAPVAHARP